MCDLQRAMLFSCILNFYISYCESMCDGYANKISKAPLHVKDVSSPLLFNRESTLKMT